MTTDPILALDKRLWAYQRANGKTSYALCDFFDTYDEIKRLIGEVEVEE